MGFIHVSLIVFLLRGIPEQSAVVTLAFIIARIPLKWNKILLIGIILTICAYVVRLLPLPFGIHTILLNILLFIILTGFGKEDYGLYLLASLLSYLALVIFEFASLSLLISVFKVTLETLCSGPVFSIVITYPHAVMLSVLAFLFKKFQHEG